MRNEIGERVADKVGRNWALSEFMLINWNIKVDDIETEKEINKKGEEPKDDT